MNADDEELANGDRSSNRAAAFERLLKWSVARGAATSAQQQDGEKARKASDDDGGGWADARHVHTS
jgi:hypothetical protein